MAVNVVSFSFSRGTTGGLGAHSAGWWLSLLHLISNFSGPQTPSGFPRAPSAGCGFPYHISSTTPSPVLNATAIVTLSWLSYIIVQRPLDRLLDLRNGMIDRHPTEITVMQFTGHSLPVHQSMGVSWASLCNGMFARVEGQNTTVIVRLEFEFAYYDSIVQRFNHYTTKTLPFLSIDVPL